jgi:hypothetical protein
VVDYNNLGRSPQRITISTSKLRQRHIGAKFRR